MAGDDDLEPGVGDAVEQPGPPLDDDDRAVEVEVEVLELGRTRQPVRVDVHERGAADEARVRSGEHERRTLHGAAHAEALADAARERGLAGPERPGEHDHVAGAQLCSELATERLHRLGVGHVATHHGASGYVLGTRGPIRVTIS